MGGLIAALTKPETDVSTIPKSKFSTWDFEPEVSRTNGVSSWYTDPYSHSYRTSTLSSDNHRYSNKDMNASIRDTDMLARQSNHHTTSRYYPRPPTRLGNYYVDSSSSSDSDDYDKEEPIRTRVTPRRTTMNEKESIREMAKYATCSHRSNWTNVKETTPPRSIFRSIDSPDSSSDSSENDWNSARYSYQSYKRILIESRGKFAENSVSKPTTATSSQNDWNATRYSTYSHQSSHNRISIESRYRPSKNSVSKPTPANSPQNDWNATRYSTYSHQPSHSGISIESRYRPSETSVSKPTTATSSQNDWNATRYSTYSHQPSHNRILNESRYRSSENSVSKPTAANSPQNEWNATRYSTYSHQPSHNRISIESRYRPSENSVSKPTAANSSQNGWNATTYRSNSTAFQASKNSNLSDSSEDTWDASKYVTYNNQTNESSSDAPSSPENNSRSFKNCVSYSSTSNSSENAEYGTNSSNSTLSNKTTTLVHPIKPAISMSSSSKNDLNNDNLESNLAGLNELRKLIEDLKILRSTQNDFVVCDSPDFVTSKTSNFKDGDNCKKLNYPQSLKSSKTVVKNISSPLNRVDSNASKETKPAIIKNTKSPVKRGMNRTKKISEGIVKKCLPSNWHCHTQHPMPESQLVYLPMDHPEFLHVKHVIEMSLKIRQVINVSRVENPYQYCMYQLKKSELNVGGKKCMEILQFHGTKTKNAFSIVMNNFDWRLHGTNVGHITGQGVSFSRLASFSSRYAENVMFVVRVLVTEFSIGDGKTVLPKHGSDTTTRYDGKVCVKFDDNTFYPEYLVTLSPSPRK